MTSTLRFNLGDVRLRDEERRELQKLSRWQRVASLNERGKPYAAKSVASMLACIYR